jgi:hypothetical protein
VVAHQAVPGNDKMNLQLIIGVGIGKSHTQNQAPNLCVTLQLASIPFCAMRLRLTDTLKKLRLIGLPSPPYALYCTMGKRRALCMKRPQKIMVASVTAGAGEAVSRICICVPHSRYLRNAVSIYVAGVCRLPCPKCLSNTLAARGQREPCFELVSDGTTK